MPSVTYMNQSAPFWDFVASLEQQGQSHPFFSQNQNQDDNERGEEGNPFGPWGWPGWGWGQQRAFPHRGPPPPHREQSGEETNTEKEGEKEKEKEKDKDAVDEKDNGEGPSGSGSGSDTEGHPCGRRGRHGGCGGRRGRHGFGGPHGHGHHGSGGFGPRHGHPHHGPPHHGRGRGHWGGPWGGRGGPFGGGFNPMDFLSTLIDPGNTTADVEKSADKSSEQDFTPEADIFDTPSSYVVHISLPGAKKEDVGVNWDAEKSELSIAGVIYRPGDEEFLKTLAMDERKVGPFERKIRLGTRANPASIDAEGISAKLEDGVLRVDVPKLEGEFVEVRKVDIE